MEEEGKEEEEEEQDQEEEEKEEEETVKMIKLCLLRKTIQATTFQISLESGLEFEVEIFVEILLIIVQSIKIHWNIGAEGGMCSQQPNDSNGGVVGLFIDRYPSQHSFQLTQFADVSSEIVKGAEKYKK